MRARGLLRVVVVGQRLGCFLCPAVICSIGMLSGFCGTLMTPLAANFNLVPAALLELPDRYAVIKAQIPTALPLLIVNVVLMYVLAF